MSFDEITHYESKAGNGIDGRWLCGYIVKREYSENGYGKNVPVVKINISLTDYIRFLEDVHLVVSITLNPKIYHGSALYNLITMLSGVKLDLGKNPNPQFVPEMIEEQYVYVLFGATNSGYLKIDDIIPFHRVRKHFNYDRIAPLLIGKQNLDCFGAGYDVPHAPCESECSLFNLHGIISDKNNAVFNRDDPKNKLLPGWHCGSIWQVYCIKKQMGPYPPTISVSFSIEYGSTFYEASCVWSPVKDHELEIRSVINKIDPQGVPNMEISTIVDFFKSHERGGYLIYFDFDDKGRLFIRDLVHFKSLERMRRHILQHFDENLLRMNCSKCRGCEHCLMARSRNIKIECRDIEKD